MVRATETGIFEEVAKRCRGVQGKDKGLHLPYKQVLVHHNKLGNNFVTPLYYDELGHILKSDLTITSKWVSQSLEDTIPRAQSCKRSALISSLLRKRRESHFRKRFKTAVAQKISVWM